MLRLFLVVVALANCEAVPGGGYGASAGLAPLLTGGLSAISKSPIGSTLNSGYGMGGYGGYGGFGGFGGLGGLGNLGGGFGGVGLATPLAAAPIAAAPVAFAAPILAQPQVLEVAGDDQPIQVIFRSLGARVNVQQVHTPSGPGEVEATRSEDEPHRVIHEIYRPVIQEVREVIQPFRRLTQEIRPVLEEVHTVVAKNAHGNKLGAGAGLAGPALVGGGGGYKSKA